LQIAICSEPELVRYQPAGGLAIKIATGANALDTAAAVEQRLSELRKNYPAVHSLHVQRFPLQQ